MTNIVSQIQDLDFPDDILHTILCITPTEVGLEYPVDFTSEHVYSNPSESRRFMLL